MSKAKVLSDIEDSSDDSLPPDEVQSYIKEKIIKMAKDGECDLFRWRKEYGTMFPNLAQIAHFVLAILATNAPREKDFLTARFVLQERISHLKPEAVDDSLSSQ